MGGPDTELVLAWLGAGVAFLAIVYGLDRLFSRLGAPTRPRDGAAQEEPDERGKEGDRRGLGGRDDAEGTDSARTRRKSADGER